MTSHERRFAYGDGKIRAVCTCGWIGPGRTTETLADVTHALHVGEAMRQEWRR